MPSPSPDILVIDARWPRRALLRAQLIEEGYEAVATDDWETAKSYLRLLLKPRLVIVDLQDLPAVETLLHELREMIKPQRVLVITALGTLTPDQLHKWGFHTIARPAIVADIVAKASALLRRSTMDAGRLQIDERA